MSASLYTETNLMGVLETPLSPTDTTVQVRFFEKNNPSTAREPQEQQIKLTLSRGKKNQEEILFSEHETSGEITTLTIQTRDLVKTGYTQVSGGNAKSHSEGSFIECVEGHFSSNILEKFLAGILANDAGVRMIKDGTDNKDTTIIMEGLKTAPHPFIRFIHPDNGGGFVYSENGVDSTPFGTGAGITTGDGIDLTAGVMSLLLKAGAPFEFIAGELSLKTSSVVGSAGDLAILGADGKIDKVILQNAIRNDALANWAGSVDVAPSASEVKKGFDNLSLEIVNDPIANIIIAVSSTLTWTDSSTAVKIKEITVDFTGTVLLEAQYYRADANYNGGSNYAFYKNGNSVFPWNGGASTAEDNSWAIKQLEISVVPGDKLQVYGWETNTQTSTGIQNFTIKGRKRLVQPTATVNL